MALGAVLYEMCFGQPLFSGPLADVMDQHESMAPGVARGVQPPLTDLVTLIERMLTKDPLLRPGVAEVAQRLKDLAVMLGGTPVADVVPAPPTLITPQSYGEFRLVPKGKKTKILVGMGVVAAVALGAALFSGNDGPTAQSPMNTSVTTVPTRTTSMSSPTTSPTSLTSTTPTTTTASPVPIQLDSLQPVAGEWDGHGGTVSVNGIVQPHSLVARLGGACGYQEGFVEYNLMRGYIELTGSLGIDDDSRSKSTSALVEVLIDDRPAFSSTIQFGEAIPMNVGLTDALRLTIRWETTSKTGDCDAGSLVLGNPKLVGIPGRMPTSGLPASALTSTTTR